MCANPHGTVGFFGNNMNVTGASAGGNFLSMRNNYFHPIVLSQNEGVLISWGSLTAPVPGPTIVIELCWAEVVTF